MEHVTESRYNELLWVIALIFIAVGVCGILSLTAFLYMDGYI